MNNIIKNQIRKLILNYENKCLQKGKFPYASDLENKLASLYPGKEKMELSREYYIEKIYLVTLLGIAAIFLLLLLGILSLSKESEITDTGMIKRNSYDGNEKNIRLIAIQNNEKIDIPIIIDNRKYTKEQAESLMTEAAQVLEEHLIGDNESLSIVTGEINPVTELEGYPFNIRWETSNYEMLHEDGTRGNEEPLQTGSEVIMKAVISYDEVVKEFEYKVVLYPENLSYIDQLKKEIISSIQIEQEMSKYDEFVSLPVSDSNGEIIWRESKDPIAIVMAILLGIMLVFVWMGIDNDLTKKYEKRNRLLSLEYSEFVSKLQLLISSGMTIRTAFERMGDDYKLSLKSDGDRKYVYEELLICINKMKDGVSESYCYELFGNRCILQNYKKLSTLLIQNLRKGSSGLVNALANETKQAFEERKNTARKLGEEAQTKLLFPMIIMLGVVMIIIMVPAYISFGV